MRLLQLATAPQRLIDLHPNLTVVAGLDDADRKRLSETITGLARGTAPGTAGLLEAHGVLFDLSDEMVEVLEVVAPDLRPVVTASDLPTVGRDPRARERVAAERALVELEGRWAAADAEIRRLQTVHAKALDALERARRNAHEADAGAAERIRLIDELTADLDALDEHRRRLLERQAALGPEAEQAMARRLEVEAATADVRTRHQELALRCSELAGQLDEARLALDPSSVPEAEEAAADLADVEAEVAAERAEAAADDPSTGPPATERLASVQERIEEIEKRLAAFGPAERREVESALAALRARDSDTELVPSPHALAMADQLAELDADLAATSGIGTTSGDLAAGRARLEAAREAHLAAEQAVRRPELDRELVHQLENAHAEVLEALDKADGRFAGGRAQRRVDAARAVEHALLDELGFGSYSDYMMGYSLQTVEPEKEATLDAARAELSAAEDAWAILQAETEAELARAERVERRRLLLDEARTVLGRAASPSTVVEELRELRVPATLPPELVEALERALDAAGLAVGGEDLPREELVLLADAWLGEAADAEARERELRSEHQRLVEERVEALAAVEAEAARAADLADARSAEEERVARLAAAAAAAEAAGARRRAHLEADVEVTRLTAALAGAAEEERLAAEAAAEAGRAAAEATALADGLAAELATLAEDLRALDADEAGANEHLQSLTALETATREDLARDVGAAGAILATAEEELRAATQAAQAVLAEQDELEARLAVLRDGAEPVAAGEVAEEIEWYLLARLAAQRAACLGGSLPILLDDALEGLDEEQVTHVLGRLERMADAVQVIVVSDDPLAASWATAAGDDRAALVRPQPA